MNAIECHGYPSRAAAVRSYRIEHPHATHQEVADALWIPVDAVHNASRNHDRPSCVRRKVTPERTLALLPMLDGPGDRHEDCQRYLDCLSRAASVDGEAHCPEECPAYCAVSPDYYRAQAMVPRESGPGWASPHLQHAGLTW